MINFSYRKIIEKIIKMDGHEFHVNNGFRYLEFT